MTVRNFQAEREANIMRIQSEVRALTRAPDETSGDRGKLYLLDQLQQAREILALYQAHTDTLRDSIAATEAAVHERYAATVAPTVPE